VGYLFFLQTVLRHCIQKRKEVFLHILVFSLPFTSWHDLEKDVKSTATLREGTVLTWEEISSSHTLICLRIT
jgi:hypothetical protein